MARKLPLLFILITVMIDAMGVGLIMPVMPQLIQKIQGTDLSQAAIWGGILATVFAVMQFLFSPVLGALSDRFGRRPILLTSTAIMALDYVLMAVAHSFALLLIGRIIGGITAATHSTASAYMADISSQNDKARNFGLIGAAFGIGFVLGPVMGGLLAELGARAPFWAAAGLAGLNFLLGYVVLPETLRADHQRRFQWSRANPVGSLRQITTLPNLSALLWVFFLFQLANFVYPVIWSYYTIKRFNWGPDMIGVSLAVYGICAAMTQAVLVPKLVHRLGEAKTVLWGLAYEVVILWAVSIAPTGGLLLALTPLTALGAATIPALQAVMSRRAGDDQQGELQGVLSSLNALGMILAPVVMTWIFARFSNDTAPIYLPGAPFFLASLLMMGAWVIYYRASFTSPEKHDAP